MRGPSRVITRIRACRWWPETRTAASTPLPSITKSISPVPDFAVSGYSVPGVPGTLHFCHNEYVAWGMTYGSADTQDLFVERFRETADGLEYEFRGAWRPAEILREEIHVRGAASVTSEVVITHHGPIIAGDPRNGQAIAISDPGLIEGTPWADAARDAMCARSVEDLHQAFARWNDRVNNYAVADIHGCFGYLHEGRIPVREAANGWSAVPGWSGEHEWQGYIPHAELPKAIDPRNRLCHHLQSARDRVRLSLLRRARL